MTYLDNEIQKQIDQCINLLKDVLGQDLLGIYLYGSSVVGGLQKYSDIDLFVISNRSTTHEEKSKLIANLLQISGIYMRSSKLPIELTIVVKSEINPWHYPAKFDFQYGDWLREEFESGTMAPWPTKVMPDLALLITKVLLASETLFGLSPNQLLCSIPYRDVIHANKETLKDLRTDLNSDTRNVLLTYARIWSHVETDTERSKPAAAAWAMDRLPKEYKPVMKRARAICIGEEKEYWDDIKIIIEPCADFMANEINKQIALLELSDCANKSIKVAENSTD